MYSEYEVQCCFVLVVFCFVFKVGGGGFLSHSGVDKSSLNSGTNLQSHLLYLCIHAKLSSQHQSVTDSEWPCVSQIKSTASECDRQ